MQSAGWLLRPGPWLTRLRDRYGPTFTIRIANEPDWVVLSDPDAVRQVFTGDPQVLHAGEANAILRPMLGPRSVLLLDDAEHMAPAQAAAAAVPRRAHAPLRATSMRAIAEREVAGWPAGAAVEARPRMQAITLEVIMRAVFGVEDPRAARAAAGGARADARLDDRPAPPASLIAGIGPRRLESVSAFRAAMDPVHALLDEEIAPRPRRPAPRGPRGHPRAAARRPATRTARR